MEVAILFVMVIGLMLLGVPIAVSLGMSSILFLLVLSDTSMASIAQTLFQAMAGHYTLLAIPFFILASSFMSTGGVARRIIRFSIAIVGHFPGGLAIAGVFACMMFAALSGSSPATVVAIGSIVIAGMRQVGYSKDFAAGVIANAGTLGILIPPSIVMVVYASATDVSVGRMFLAGVIPGLLAGTMLMLTIYIIAVMRDLPKGDWKGWGEVAASGREAGWGLFLIVIILGGIYGGIFTPTEASSIAVVYALFVGLFVYRSLTFAKIYTALRTSAISSTVIMIIIAGAGLFSFLVTRSGLPAIIAEWVQQVFTDRISFLMAVNVFLFIVGMFVETSAAILVLAPLLAPIAIAYGVDPVHFGLIIVVNLALGMFTPPVGVNLFAACAVAKISIQKIIPALVPMVLVVMGCVLLVTYVPFISLGLVELFYR